MKWVMLSILIFAAPVFACRTELALSELTVSSAGELNKYLELSDFAELLADWDEFLDGKLNRAEERRFLKRFGLERPALFEEGLAKLEGLDAKFLEDYLTTDRRNRFGQWLLMKAMEPNRYFAISEIIGGVNVTELYRSDTRKAKMKRLLETTLMQHTVLAIEAFFAEKIGDGGKYRVLEHHEKSHFLARLIPMKVCIGQNDIEKKIVDRYRAQQLALGISPDYN